MFLVVCKTFYQHIAILLHLTSEYCLNKKVYIYTCFVRNAVNENIVFIKCTELIYLFFSVNKTIIQHYEYHEKIEKLQKCVKTCRIKSPN